MDRGEDEDEMGKRDQAAGGGAHRELMKAEPYWAGIENALRAREVRARAYALGRPAPAEAAVGRASQQRFLSSVSAAAAIQRV